VRILKEKKGEEEGDHSLMTIANPIHPGLSPKDPKSAWNSTSSHFA
jgi:hypothetical protein